MIPNNTITTMYVRIIGENSLVSMAQSNLLAHLDRVVKVRTHTYIANNAQTEFGISRNFGHERYYSWEDTIIDCRNCPGLVDSTILEDFPEALSENNRFISFKEDLEKRMEGFITVEPFVSVLRGEDNMRYNIRRSSKIEDFDIVRVGVCLSAESDEAFKNGLKALEDWENPFKIKRQLSRA